MVNPPKHSTYYADYVYKKVDEWFKQGRAAFTLKELAAFAGLKVTPSLRRRIKHSVACGGLMARTILLEPRGSSTIFMLPPPVGTDEVPF